MPTALYFPPTRISASETFSPASVNLVGEVYLVNSNWQWQRDDGDRVHGSAAAKCLEPAAPTVPPAAKDYNHHDDNDEKRRIVQVVLLRQL